MTIFGSLDAAEQARQLANPEGPVGLAVAEWLNANNREGILQVVAMLDLRPGCEVLEIGFGNGRAAPAVVSSATNIGYAGIDISPTMVNEAVRFNEEMVSTGRANFHLAFAERMPFADASFDRVFSIGVAHFWAEPIAALREVHRVMRSGGFAVMGVLDSRSPPKFARPEFGFHLRSAEEWVALYRRVGFSSVEAQTIESDQMTPDGAPIKRYSIRVTARH